MSLRKRNKETKKKRMGRIKRHCNENRRWYISNFTTHTSISLGYLMIQLCHETRRACFIQNSVCLKSIPSKLVNKTYFNFFALFCWISCTLSLCVFVCVRAASHVTQGQSLTERQGKQMCVGGHIQTLTDT